MNPFEKIADIVNPPEVDLSVKPSNAEVIPEGEVEVIDDKAASAQDVSPAVDAPPDSYDVAAFETAFPAFRGQKVSADMRARMWQQLAMNATATKPKEAESPSRPIIRELPPIDLKAVTERYRAAIEEGDSDAALQAQQEIVNFQGAALESLTDFSIRNEYDNERLQSRIDRLEKPQLLRQAGVGVEGFQDSDVAAAQKLIDDGVTTDPGFAVRFAVTDRLLKTKSATPLSASEEAARKARAAAASSVPGSQTSENRHGPVASASFTSREYKDKFKKMLMGQPKQT